MDIQLILKKYWGYDSFRPLQEDIIQSVLNGHDTLALLPTGGGKSICFQVPAMAKEGICLVVSPLIALMKDQVENLVKKGIKAVAITSGLSYKELDNTLDNCVYGNIKFLYLSPERLLSELVRERIGRMNVNLLAVDEAHCISQWGYDFRPPYLQIAELRKILPKVPILALTATATPKVREDIQEKLSFRTKNVFQKSFERKNLAYLVLEEEDKLARLVKIASRIKGSGIVYVRNRRQTQEIANYLTSRGILADYYHAGLDSSSRSAKQDAWIHNKIRIMVATNAFGMGIDKPDVRFVVHIDLPDSLEAYYQEAGRGGRDEKKSYAVLLFSPHDKLELEQKYLAGFPTVKQIKHVYQALGNDYNLAYGSGELLSFDFDLALFCKKNKFSSIMVMQALKFIEREGLISVSEEVFLPARAKFIVNTSDVYKFQVSNPKFDVFIKLLLRSYGGMFEQYVYINERELAKRLGTEESDVVKLLSQLQVYGLLDYIPLKNKPQLQFLVARLPESNIQIDVSYVEERKRDLITKIKAIGDYASSNHECRSVLLLRYFGEMNGRNCGVCDVCISKKKGILNQNKKATIWKKIVFCVQNEIVYLPLILEKIKEIPEEEILKTLQYYIDEGAAQLNDKNEVILTLNRN